MSLPPPGGWSVPLIWAALLAVLVRRRAPRGRRPERRHLRGPKPARSILRARAGETLAALRSWRPRYVLRPRIRVGHVRLAPGLEPYHLLITGSPGSGKSSVIEALLRTLRRRGDRAIVFDLGGETWAALARAGDRLLNPLDTRSVAWSPFAEMRSGHDAARLARSLVPAGHGEGQEWHHYAQTLLTAVLERLWTRGERTNGRLLDLLLRAPDGDLRTLTAGTPAARFFAPGAERMAASVRAILGSYLPALSALDPQSGGDAFGCGSWVRSGEGSGWLFLTVRDDTFTLLRPLVSSWIDLLIGEALAQRPDPRRRLWFILDEFDSLGAIPSLLDALTKGRKYGLALVAGLQSVAQLERRYGHDGARVILACFATKVFLRSSDVATAEYASRQLGERECLVTEISRGRGGRSRVRRLQRESLVLAGEIAGLADRRGWIQRPGPVRPARVRVRPPRRAATEEPFLPRATIAPAPDVFPSATGPDPFLSCPEEGSQSCST